MPKITIYTPESSMRYPRQMFAGMLRDILDSRGLALQLAQRDIRGQYRQTLLGLAWAFFFPAANTAIWLFIQGTGIVAVQPTGISYAAFVLSGTILWSIFMDAVNAPLQQTLAARPMLTKINFPRESLILSGILQVIFNAAIKATILVTALLLLGVQPGWASLLFPFVLLALVFAGTAIGLFITPIGALYSDIGKGLILLMQFLMYLAPVVFLPPQQGWAASLFALNPLTPLIVTGRDLITDQVPRLGLSCLAIGIAACLASALALLAYRAAMPILVERMNA